MWFEFCFLQSIFRSKTNESDGDIEVVSFQLETWSAMAPGLNTIDDWQDWLDSPRAIEEPLGKVSLKEIPPLLRRRFSTPGKCALGAALPILEDGEMIPSIFASRHGDSALTLSLLSAIGRNDTMSPTGFSLAVHNAVSGLFSIARKDTSEVTTIAAMEGLVLQALIEAVGQLKVSKRVLCVIYDTPLPDPYSRCTTSDLFPYAIAIILTRTSGGKYHLERGSSGVPDRTFLPAELGSEPLRFIEMLAGRTTAMVSELNGAAWRIVQG